MTQAMEATKFLLEYCILQLMSNISTETTERGNVSTETIERGNISTETTERVNTNTENTAQVPSRVNVSNIIDRIVTNTKRGNKTRQTNTNKEKPKQGKKEKV